MRNRAKCKLCQDVLESFHLYDFVHCKCGQVSISGGQYQYQCAAADWSNFLRIDDDDKEIPVVVKKEGEEAEVIKEDVSTKLTRQEQIEMLERMLNNIENLPKHVMDTPVNHYDFYSYLLIVLSILKTPENG